MDAPHGQYDNNRGVRHEQSIAQHPATSHPIGTSEPTRAMTTNTFMQRDPAPRSRIHPPHTMAHTCAEAAARSGNQAGVYAASTQQLTSYASQGHSGDFPAIANNQQGSMVANGNVGRVASARMGTQHNSPHDQFDNGQYGNAISQGPRQHPTISSEVHHSSMPRTQLVRSLNLGADGDLATLNFYAPVPGNHGAYPNNTFAQAVALAGDQRGTVYPSTQQSTSYNAHGSHPDFSVVANGQQGMNTQINIHAYMGGDPASASARPTQSPASNRNTQYMYGIPHGQHGDSQYGNVAGQVNSLITFNLTIRLRIV
ncbi:hypothetical protein SCHPADRAFT_661993 [Schizopora paradoxa]|uniref:Uncharacterized protein n=1 Tax=Schizopora paradoxa TaxID=27342 RepID=A0A0H2RCE8_9AGAM|nr:hypothetical protein SCHPADRAFT_661993 [Schizopora paradoxa]